MNYYLDISICDEDNSFVMAKVMSIVHGYIQEQRKNDTEFQLAISFPSWKITNGLKAEIGKTLRLFSTEPGLNKFIEQKPVNLFLKRKSIFFDQIRKIPEVNSFIKFSRDRTLEKTTVHYKQKIKTLDYPRKSEPTPSKTPTAKGNTYFFKLGSLSTEQKQFSLIIKSAPTTEISKTFSTYGLANSEGGVPLF